MSTEAGEPQAAQPGARSPADLTDFWTTNQAKLLGYARQQLEIKRIPSARLDADDVVQQVWVLMQEEPKVSSPSGFAYSRVRTIVFEALRQEKQCRGPSIEAVMDGEVAQDDAGLAAEAAADPVQQMIAAEDERARAQAAAQLPDALDKLTAKQREAVELCDAQEGSREDAADAMGVSIGSVSQHRDRGLRKLRETLAAGEEDLATGAWFMAAYSFVVLLAVFGAGAIGVAAGAIGLSSAILVGATVFSSILTANLTALLIVIRSGRGGPEDKD